MSQPLPISAFIITLNEEQRIGATLESLKGLVAEIVVVDSGSVDATASIAQQAGARVMFHAWAGYGPQKRFAEEQCSHDWVLNLDADEVLSDSLIQQIRSVFEPDDGTEPAALMGKVDGYHFTIRDCIPGEARPRPFAHTTKAVRLYNKTRGRYAPSPVHDRVAFHVPSPHIHTLSAPVYHYSVTSMEQAIAKLNRYSTMLAEDMAARGKFPAWLGARLVVEFPAAFVKSYLLRGDILRGRKGFINAMTYAFSRFARLAKACEKRPENGSGAI